MLRRLYPSFSDPVDNPAINILREPKAQESFRNQLNEGRRRHKEPGQTLPEVGKCFDFNPVRLLEVTQAFHDGAMLTIHVGLGGGDEVSAFLPAWAELGLCRLEELLNISKQVRLRFFSFADVTALANGREVGAFDSSVDLQELIIMEWINFFKPNLLKHVSFERPAVSDDLREMFEQGHDPPKSIHPDLLNKLRLKGGRKGGEDGKANAERYIYAHSFPAYFRDGLESNNVAVAGLSERAFADGREFYTGDKMTPTIIVRPACTISPPPYGGLRKHDISAVDMANPEKCSAYLRNNSTFFGNSPKKEAVWLGFALGRTQRVGFRDVLTRDIRNFYVGHLRHKL